MQSQQVSRLFRGLVRLIMLLTAIAAAFVAQGYLVAKIVQHNKSLRPILLKPDVYKRQALLYPFGTDRGDDHS